ncbi:hypothetical protein BD770DRAFT_413514 [Pilaira anomala]|nr:hypothetical protein BD770DRAFT_413514 [Pilaira anomala]
MKNSIIVADFDSLKAYLKFSVSEEYRQVVKEFNNLYTFLMVQCIYISCKELKTGWSYRIMHGNTYAENKNKHHRFIPLKSMHHYKKNLIVLFQELEDIQAHECYQFSSNLTERLSREIEACYEASSVSKEESIKVEITNFLTKEIQKAFNDPELTVEQIRSANNYLDSEGVLGLSIRIPQNRVAEGVSFCDNTDKINSLFDVYNVANHLQNMGMEAVLPLPLADRTIFTHPPSNLQCTIGVDFSFLSERNQLISEYLDLDKRIRPLVFSLIKFTKMQSINKSSRVNLLSSFSYIFMILHFLMNVIKTPLIPNLQKEINGCESLYCNYNNVANGLVRINFKNKIQTVDIRYHSCIHIINNPPADGYNNNKINNKTIWNSSNNDNVGTLFLGLLQYYSKIFNYKMIWIGSNNACQFEKFDLKDWQDSPVWIQDPFIPQRNIARTSKYHPPIEVTRTFAVALKKLKNGDSYSDICEMKL